MVRSVNGFTGKLDTIYDSYSTIIVKRIGVTDSIIWNEYQDGKLKYTPIYYSLFQNNDFSILLLNVKRKKWRFS